MDWAKLAQWALADRPRRAARSVETRLGGSHRGQDGVAGRGNAVGGGGGSDVGGVQASSRRERQRDRPTLYCVFHGVWACLYFRNP